MNDWYMYIWGGGGYCSKDVDFLTDSCMQSLFDMLV